MVTEESAPTFSIVDVVLPLFGSMTPLPPLSLAHSYLEDELEALHLTQEELSSSYGKKLCFKGRYRKIAVKPSNVSFKIIPHPHSKDELQSPFYTIGEGVEVAAGAKRAVQIMLQLPKSSYATMALREILHIPSSFEMQMTLNKLYE
jgi:tRNA(Glu) U13 pseudouridine synthase TruD